VASVPVEKLHGSEPISLPVTIPNDDQWKRIRQRWGLPGFFLAIFSRSPNSDSSYESLPIDQLKITAFGNNGVLESKVVENYTYPHLNSGPQSLVRFVGLHLKVGLGDRIRLEIVAPKEGYSFKGELVVMAYFTAHDVKVGMSDYGSAGLIASILGIIGTAIIFVGIRIKAIAK
jgi:hypothetical protein